MSDSSAEGQPLADWWAMPAGKLAGALDVDLSQGLARSQVERHRERYGSNRLEDMGPTSVWTLAWESVRSPMMLLLLAIAGISLLLGQVREAIVMAFVVATYVGVHLLNKARADRTMARLREVQAPQATMRREGEACEIPVADVVVGDMLPLQAGTRVAADGRLLSSVGLLVDEAPLTGESAPVRKDADAELDAGTPLAERTTAVFAGTTVLDGQGRALVAAVGAHSELGRVAELTTQAEDEPTPLQREMDDLARTLAFVAIGVSLLIPLLGLLQGFGLQQMILTWLSLTFLMVPGQPPIIIAMALALASLELARKEVIVRRLHGAETLGTVTVVLSDKTGTMTENRMALDGALLPDGGLISAKEPDDEEAQDLARFFRFALPAIPDSTRDPTDVAVTDAAAEFLPSDDADWGRLVNQKGFSRGYTYRALEYRQDASRRTFIAGRPEFVIDRSDRRRTRDGVVEWPPPAREQLKARIEQLAAEGRRMIAYAHQDGGLGEEDDATAAVFVGAAVISDPIRLEVEGAVTRLREAGIRVLMVHGRPGPDRVLRRPGGGAEWPGSCVRRGAGVDA